MEYHRNPHAPPPGLALRDIGLAVLRVVTGLTVVGFHARDEVMNGWRHLWHKEPWAFAASLAESQFPLPVVVATVASVVALLSSLFLVSGLLTRLSAGLMLGMAMVGAFLYWSIPVTAEKLVIYMAIYGALLLAGPGRFSMDALLAGRRA